MRRGASGSSEVRSPLEELSAVAEPPLRYLATADPRRLAPNALPVAHLLSLIERAGRGADPDRLRGLEELGRLLSDFPLEPPSERKARAEAGLRLLEAIRSGRRTVQPGLPIYRRTDGPVAADLERLARPAQFVRGVGPRRAEQLARFGLRTLEDLLFHLPFRYEDRRQLKPIAELVPGEWATTVVTIAGAGEKRVGPYRRRLLEAIARDDSGAVLTLVWFQRIQWFQSRLRPGTRLVVHGKVEVRFGRRRIVHPEIEILEGEEGELGRIVPVYGKPTEMTVGTMRKIVRAALEAAGERVPSVLPSEVARSRGLMDLGSALRVIHDPPLDADVEALNAARSAAHRSVIFDELFFVELAMLGLKQSIAAQPGISFRPAGILERRLRETLPFRLTGAQERVLAEIGRDMAAPHPMNRLVQGDVGSGKTVVAAIAALRAIECGYQVALMAPTEVLAEQHHATVRAWLEPLGVAVELLTGRVSGRARREILGGIASGQIPFVVGTHALIQQGVRFARLGLAIVDEQHRFGVRQRQALQGLGENPDVLLMTATPIPRTLSMTLYGDLDLSFLDELPPGRKPVETVVVSERDRSRAYARVREEIERGRQAYLVFPLVQESEKTSLRSAKAMVGELAAGPLRGTRLALLHGQMKPEEKEGVLRRFRAGDFQALVATTVIEVGIDVPNATVMMVDHAEQFGLAQLHQLRGRVGRGAERSLCLLVSSGRGGLAGYERLKLLERETDGARIAEADLMLRGPGELLGLRQSGLPGFRTANLVRDVRILEEAREEAQKLLARDPGLRSPESQALRQVLEHRLGEKLALAQVG